MNKENEFFNKKIFFQLKILQYVLLIVITCYLINHVSNIKKKHFMTKTKQMNVFFHKYLF
jgi:hypothetical protein